MIKHWIVPFFLLLIFGGITILFLTPSLTESCTIDLFVCLEDGMNKGFWGRSWAHLGCVCQNVFCVFAGLFE